jgi:hypothetical protein
MSYQSDGDCDMPKPPLTLRDWLFGAGGKRRVIEGLLTTAARSWTQTELARSARLHPKGSVDVHLAALVQLGIVAESDGSYVVDGDSPLVAPLRQIVELVASLEDAKLNRPTPSGTNP